MSSKIIKFKIHLTYLALSLSFNILSHWVLIFMAQKMIKNYRNIKNSKKKKNDKTNNYMHIQTVLSRKTIYIG